MKNFKPEGILRDPYDLEKVQKVVPLGMNEIEKTLRSTHEQVAPFADGPGDDAGWRLAEAEAALRTLHSEK